MNVPMTLPGVWPSVRRIAMSDCLSVTSMTSVETRLNAATATISERIRNMTFFSIATALKKLLWPCIQSVMRYIWPSSSASERPTANAWNMSSRRRSDSGRPIEAIQRLGVLHVHDGKAGVVFLHAGLENADDGEPLEPWQRADRRHAEFRREHGDVIADVEPAERLRELLAEHDAETAGGEIGQFAAHHALVDFRYVRFEIRHHAADQRARIARTLQHRFALDVRRRAEYVRICLRPIERVGPVAHGFADARDRRMRNHAEDAVLELLVEAVHHRDHGDQRRYADRDAEDRHQRDERDEMVAPLRPRIAQADEDFEGSEHAGFGFLVRTIASVSATASGDESAAIARGRQANAASRLVRLRRVRAKGSGGGAFRCQRCPGPAMRGTCGAMAFLKSSTSQFPNRVCDKSSAACSVAEASTSFQPEA